MSDEVCEVVITGPNQDWVASFTSQLVDDRLAACGHTINVIRSIYRWEDSVHDETEARASLHTRRSLVSAIVDRAHRDHRTTFRVSSPCPSSTATLRTSTGY